MSRPTKMRVRRALVGGLAGLTGATLLVGLMHTPVARPWMARVGRELGIHTAGCPLGYDRKATSEERATSLAAFAADHHGEREASARPALGFALGSSTIADVQAWAASHDVTCHTESRSGHDLECEHVADQDLVWLDFDDKGSLASVIGVRRDTSATATSRSYETIRGELTERAGPPTIIGEDAAPEKLASAPLYQAMTEYRFRNYYAVVRATNVGHGSYLLTEQLRALSD